VSRDELDRLAYLALPRWAGWPPRQMLKEGVEGKSGTQEPLGRERGLDVDKYICRGPRVPSYVISRGSGLPN